MSVLNRFCSRFRLRQRPEKRLFTMFLHSGLGDMAMKKWNLNGNLFLSDGLFLDCFFFGKFFRLLMLVYVFDASLWA